MRLYPKDGYLQLNLATVWDRGHADAAERLLEKIKALNPTRKLAGQRLPSLLCTDIAFLWEATERVLIELTDQVRRDPAN